MASVAGDRFFGAKVIWAHCSGCCKKQKNKGESREKGGNGPFLEGIVHRSKTGVPSGVRAVEFALKVPEAAK